MEKLLDPYEKQYMKMAMLKHEETFKQQVYELHRLYQVQKILMKNMQINERNNVSSGLGTFIKRCDQLANIPGGGESGGNNIEIMDESDIELTLGPSCYGDLMRMKKKKKNNSLPEMMDGNLNSGRRRSFSLSSTESSNNNHSILEEQMKQERLMKHQKQKQPWLQTLTLNVI